MLLVPLAGDTVEVQGVSSTVLSFSNYGSDGPSVYIEATDSASKSSQVPYLSISKINDTPVSLTGGKVFKSPGRVKRSIQLPQIGDKITSAASIATVKNLKLAVKGDLTGGMLIMGEDYDTKDKVQVYLSDVTYIERASGNDLFSLKTFRTLYKEYMGKN